MYKDEDESHQLFDNDMRSAFDFSSTTTFTSSSYDSLKYGSIFHYNNNNYTKLHSLESDEPLYSRITRSLVVVLCFVIVLCTFPISFIFCLKKVPALERIVVFRLGKLQKVKGPGYVITLPCVDHFIRVDLRPQIFSVPKNHYLTRDGGILEIEVQIHYQLIDIVQSVLQVDKLNEVVKSLATQCLTTAITSRDQEDVEKHIDRVQFDIKELLNKSTISWGLEVTRIDTGSIIIAKAAETNTAINTLVTSLKSAMGLSNEDELTKDKHSTSLANQDGIYPTTSPPNQVIQKLRQRVFEATSQGQLNDISGILKMVITDYGNIYIVIRDGQGEVTENGEIANVSVYLTLESLLKLIDGVETPYEAYSNGSVEVKGDYQLLISFAQKITHLL